MLKPNAKGKANINSQKCINIKLCHVYAALEKATTSGNKQGKTSVTISPGSQTFTLIHLQLPVYPATIISLPLPKSISFRNIPRVKPSLLKNLYMSFILLNLKLLQTVPAFIVSALTEITFFYSHPLLLNEKQFYMPSAESHCS